MLRLPVSKRLMYKKAYNIRHNSSSSFIRKSFIEYFANSHGHKHVKSSSVVPLCDPSVPFVNAGMNQFKGVFLGYVDAPHPRVVNSQKCVRVGGKHNDLDVVGTDGTHHTFFEMLGNWSFGDYYKTEACKMAWDLLLGPYRLKPEKLLVTYFAGDPIIGLIEDRECRDVWKSLGVSPSRLEARGSADNFWEMGQTGPCGPCSEIHYINPDGTLTEIWNLVFIHCNRDPQGKVHGLRQRHVDTGMGLERMAAVMQGVGSNYDTDLFRPIIEAIEKSSIDVSAYGGRYGPGAELDAAYRRLADHARMLSVCLADSVFPGTSLNLKQIMRKSFKLSTDVFHRPGLVGELYGRVAESLGEAYPSLRDNRKQSENIIMHEEEAYRKLRSDMQKKWKDLAKQYPEVEVFSDVELPGFAQGYREYKQIMSKQKEKMIPGDLVFKLYDTYGFPEELVLRMAEMDNAEVDIQRFWKLYTKHSKRHKTAITKQVSTPDKMYQDAIEKLVETGIKSTNDQPKYNYKIEQEKIVFEPLKTNLIAILNEDLEWVDFLEPAVERPYILVTKDSNFYCEEGGQIFDKGKIALPRNNFFSVENAFKIRDFVFHKGYFTLDKTNATNYFNKTMNVVLEIDAERRLSIMQNHTGVHLLNAAMRKVLPNSGLCQLGSGVSEKGLQLSLSAYGEKLSAKKITDAQELVRQSIDSAAQIRTRVLDSVQLSGEADVVTVPGQVYPETGLRLVQTDGPLMSKELCCGTHLPSTGYLEEFCITHVKGAGSANPTVYAITGDRAKQARELFCHTDKLLQVLDLLDDERRLGEVSSVRAQLADLCAGSGAPQAEYKECLARLEQLEKGEVTKNEMTLQSVAAEELRSAASDMGARGFVVHFLRCSYLLPGGGVSRALAAAAPQLPRAPALLLGCAGGAVVAACHVPQEMVTSWFNAERWLNCVLPVFSAALEPPRPPASPHTYAQMAPTKVSLITCEQQVQDAMRVAIKFAQAHHKETNDSQMSTRN